MRYPAVVERSDFTSVEDGLSVCSHCTIELAKSVLRLLIVLLSECASGATVVQIRIGKVIQPTGLAHQ